MIKLNNNNITYVALADSSNSLKAPKEIWYADSNNSVKLVYRRKDALIEGEDYEKYHWIIGDGVAYIDGLDYNLWQNTLQIQIGKVDGNCQYFGLNILYNSQTRNGSFFQLMSSNGIFKTYFRDRLNEQGWVGWFNLNDMPSVVAFEYYTEDYKAAAIVNGVKTYDTISSNTLTESVWNKYIPLNTKDGNNIYTKLAKVSYIRELLPNNTYRSNLIPCKLLKPVPKWLDANGIRRQVGECGMIDLVSGKFYGNVNSNGTFTVENYYERKEWLQGDGEAFINTLINPSFGDEISAEGVITSRPNIDNIAFISACSGDDCFGLYTGGYYHRGGLPQYVILHTSSVRTEYIAFRPQEDGKFKMQCQLTKNSVPQYFLLIDNVIVHPDLVKATINQVPTSSYRIGYFVVDGLSANIGLDTCKLSKVTINSHTLIPCTLTMDLPASMDANGISRTKGTSGMWDLVSDRFYGNVASSGTFKAVNLAEGVDYERHKWLVADIPIGAAMMSLPINSSTFNCTIEHTGARANLPHLYSDGYIYYTESSNMDMIAVWNISEANIPFSASVGSLMIIESNEEYFKVNNISIPKYGFPILRMVIQSSYNSNNATTTKTSSITIDGIDRYIPVKLLKSIPSKYDANGIARNAGECGMYDTVNDVFYGNVASSGSFTVEDDS